VSAPQPYPYPYPVAPRRTNPLAVVTLVLGLCGFAVLPVVTGHVALAQIRRTGDGGTALAVVGLVLGYLAAAAYALVLLLVVAGFVVWGGAS
jgi:uncharacterized membrane protein YjfL (UPF0719 family)